MSHAAVDEAGGLTRSWRPSHPLDIATTLRYLQRGPGDPTQRHTREGIWRAHRTPLGPVTLCVGRRSGEVVATAWGPGAPWALAGVPDLLGARDHPEDLPCDGVSPLVVDAHRQHAGMRQPRTGLVFDAVVPSVLEQKVTSVEAFRSWRELVRRHGEPAPGPAPQGMTVPPDADTLAQLPDWEWHRAGIDGRRRSTIIAAARRATAIDRLAELDAAAARQRLLTLPGVGPWTAAEVTSRSHGDADTVPVGDFHLPSVVGMALTGRPLDDAGLLEALAPYRPQRLRVIRLLAMVGGHRPRFAPRYPIRDNRSR